MFKKLFKKGPEETPPTDGQVPPAPAPPQQAPPVSPPAPGPAEPPAEVSPEAINATLDEVIAFLKDVGLNEADIIDATSCITDEPDESAHYEPPKGHIMGVYRDMFSEDLVELEENKHGLIHQLLACSKIGMDVDRKWEDEGLLEGLRTELEPFGVAIDFSPHEYEQSFKITVRRGDVERTADVDQSGGEMFITEKMDLVNGLLRDFGLSYVEMDSGGENAQYFLMEDEHMQALSDKYGDFLEQVINTP